MGEDQEIEVQVTEEHPAATGAKAGSAGPNVGKAISGIMESLESALSGRGNAVMVRVNDEALGKLDMLVEAGICKSRSESAAFLLQRGIDSSGSLFDRIISVTTQITHLREDLLSAADDPQE